MDPDTSHADESVPPRLLIVDDVADNCAILARHFGRRGYETVVAQNGRQALLLVEEQPFDAVLLDVVMPDMDGLEVLSRIRARLDRAALPVIMVTALTETSDVVKALTLGANDYLTKPVDFEIAQARVWSQIERHRAHAKLGHLVAENREAKDLLQAAMHERFEQLRAEVAALSQSKLDANQKALVERIQACGAELVQAAAGAMELSSGAPDQKAA